ncbi:hypothetical protein NST63_26670 [Heyndrickxia sp. FSL W8-0496]|uniref:hypothetical protein n=1 Tax=Heyndrickxia TaxID=2837504 RepID=UPI0030F96108
MRSLIDAGTTETVSYLISSKGQSGEKATVYVKHVDDAYIYILPEMDAIIR